MQPDSPDPLGPGGEAEWRRLHRYLELAEGFWLGFLFTSSPPAATVFRARTERFLRSRVRSLRLIRPGSPEALREVLQELFEPASLEAGCVWVEALEVDRGAASAGPWTLAWDSFFLRLNERRERLIRYAQGGLVLTAPVAIKPRVREAAPDLWSIRGIVLEPPLVRRPAEPVQAGKISKDQPSALQLTRPAERPVPAKTGVEEPETKEALERAALLLREAQGFLSLKEPGQAREPALEAVALLRQTGAARGEVDLAHALALLARLEAASGDPGAATEHLEEAYRLQRATPSRETLEWLDQLGNLAGEGGEIQRAITSREESLQIARRLLDLYGETPQSLRDLSVSLDNLGDVRREAGDPEATAAYQESLQIRRRLLDLYGETPQSLRDLSVSLNKLGDVRGGAGDLAEATAAYQESLQIRRRLLDLYGETPQSLRDLSVSLDRIGVVLQKSGDLAGAISAFEEALSLVGRHFKLYGETPGARQFLEAGESRLAALRVERGEPSPAAASDDAAT